eukprot:TRINITY_DN74788_c0_g1_i1.p1 TRINITY_DN74788_c0_g1~~TRINITY_DN74788_c0_g1_i1.p1  ORF type:complete len:392 (+),score=53.20 TRINITY_DN74788_c0_g1_i1:31-1206(+)
MDCVNSDEVHDEIRALAVREKNRIMSAKNLEEDGILAALEQYGPAPGAQKMMDKEMQAALTAIDTGIYVVFRSSTGEDCFRVAPTHSCFCGHTLSEHNNSKRRVPCLNCKCNLFQFMFSRPEEIGENWLVRRKNFDIRTWAPKCRCNHTHKEHRPDSLKCTACTCHHFNSNFLCMVCDKHWEEHETLFETEQDRVMQGKPVGEAFKPLASVDTRFSEIVFGKKNDGGIYVKAPPNAYQRSIKPQQPSSHRGGGGGGSRGSARGRTPSSNSSRGGARGGTQQRIGSGGGSSSGKPRSGLQGVQDVQEQLDSMCIAGHPADRPSSSSSSTSVSSGPSSARGGTQSQLHQQQQQRPASSSSSTKLPKFCPQCGSAYPTASSKFCANCGHKRGSS